MVFRAVPGQFVLSMDSIVEALQVKNEETDVTFKGTPEHSLPNESGFQPNVALLTESSRFFEAQGAEAEGRPTYPLPGPDERGLCQ